ncbi:MAG TPA: hypothetical protein PK941_11970 [Paludibacter sp.]|nr:hypothetical protein [Paludibacter sp.]
MKKNYDQKKWFFKTIILISILLIATGVCNFAIDSAGVFSHNELKEAAKALINDKMIAGLSNYDERQLQKLIIENSDKKINTIFLGSSRGMQLRQSYLRFGGGSQKFFNHGMSGSSLEDYMAIIGLYESKGYLPKKVIIGVDPWIFNKNSGQFRWKSIGQYYKNILGKMNAGKLEVDLSDNSKYLQLINLDYTVANLNSIITLKKKHKFYITNTIAVDDFVREPDGSIHYSYNVRFQKDIDTQISAKMAANAPVYSLEMFYKLSNTKLFEDFIAYLQQNGIEVIFLLPPYHPITYNLLVKDPKYKIIMDVEIYLKNLASSRNLKITGSYNPQNDNFSSVDFSDGKHGKDIVMKKLCEKF